MRTHTPTPVKNNVSRPTAARNGPGATASTDQTLFGSLELMGAPMSFTKGAEIYGENEPADYLYRVVGGSVRTYKVLCDGRRQIGAFYFPGDVFGLEVGREHTFSAEATADSTVLVVRRSAVMACAARNNEVANELLTFTGQELNRAHDHIMLLVKTAQERVAAFLLEMADRFAGNAVELPMSRQDIADYLGLTIETVSRTLTQLENEATITVPTSRRIVLRNRGVLNRLNA
jgi:CRP-like cAMP-binding protein